jgi:hypothetical protein
VKSPVLFIIFNRPDTTALVFERIRMARPPRLYVAADGPRETRKGERESCNHARQIATAVDWPCETRTLFRDRNLGCKEAVSSCVDWFFDQEEEGIVLEDDCVPSLEFFTFCDRLLEHYRFDNRIRHISGTNLQHGQKRGDASYYFSRLTHVWGWASWRRVWQDYDKTLARYSLEEVKTALSHHFPEPHLQETWLHIATEIRAGKIDTWDFQLALANIFQHGLSIIPAGNLISNIGFDQRATHTQETADPRARLPISSLGEDWRHPRLFVPNRNADLYTLDSDSQKEKTHRETLAASSHKDPWLKRKWKKLTRRR